MEQSFNILLERYLTGRFTQEERQHFLQEISAGQYAEELNDFIDTCMQQNTFAGEVDSTVKELIYQRIKENVLAGTKPKVIADEFALSVHRIHFLKTAWFKYAAAILIIAVGIGAYLWNANNKAEQSLASGNKQLQTDILPGGEKAMLILADGSKIILDNAANGSLAQQGNAEVVKLANGQVAYNLKGIAGGAVMMNTMATPKGGQYQLTLPDGSKVWLNAASSIQFPAAFVGSEREVRVTGEVYFEIAKNKQKPFIVDVDGKMDVQVLGTSFNINSYADEESIKATLVEGSVKVANGNKQVILKPGQQAITTAAMSSGRQPASPFGTSNSDKLTVTQADLSKTLAWRNGIFDFTGADLKSVMKQLERWYDIKVQYAGTIPKMTFDGKMYRNVNLSGVLEMLNTMNVKFRMEGKTLIVL